MAAEANPVFPDWVRPPLVGWVAIGGAFVASFMPWASVWIVTVNGTDGDGMLTALLAASAAALFGWANPSSDAPNRGMLAGAAGVMACVTLVYLTNLLNVSRIASSAEPGLASPEMGLYVGLVASVVAVGAMATLLLRSRSTAS